MEEKKRHGYTEEERQKILDLIMTRIENGDPLRQAIKNCIDIEDVDNVNLSSATFFIWRDKYPDIAKRYARAAKTRADHLFEKIRTIARRERMTTETIVSPKGVTKIKRDNVQRSKLEIDAIKWQIAKMNPEKYGEKQLADDVKTEQPFFPDIHEDNRPTEES